MQYLVTVTIPDEAIQRLEAEYGADVTAGDIAIWLTESIEQTNESKIAGGFTAEARLVPA